MDVVASQMVSQIARLVLVETEVVDVVLPQEYFYKSLPLALIDAVFSIGVTYKSTQNTVERFCQNQCPEWALYRSDQGPERTLADLLAVANGWQPSELAANVYGNRQRTSSRNGILKAEAVTRCAVILRNHGVERFSDAHLLHDNPELDRDFRLVPGQISGISLGYFKMLCGDDNGIKHDRHIQAFMTRHGIASIAVLKAIARELEISPRVLDYAIWQKMSRTGT